MAHFIKCSCESVTIKDGYGNNEIVKNYPINIDFVKYITFNDNIIDNMYFIYFLGIDIKWRYIDKDERDRDYERITNNLFNL